MGSPFPKRLARPALQANNSSFRISESGAADVGRSAAAREEQYVAVRMDLAWCLGSISQRTDRNVFVN
jgi:hypothetical protein